MPLPSPPQAPICATAPSETEAADRAVRRMLDLICEHLERRNGGLPGCRVAVAPQQIALRALLARLADIQEHAISASEHAERLADVND